MTKKVSLDEVKNLAYEFAIKYLDWDEPIPEFETRFPGILESCLEQPFQNVYGEVLYRGVTKKASMLFYLMIKNHPFKNGNKRLAVLTTLLFLHKNSRWLYVSNQRLYELAVEVSKSEMKDKENVINALNVLLAENIKNKLPE
ncbi:MAG: type II toxin-antitoxin system death-on-curing family toxin [Candidatus Dojkabacteria bacterium]